MEKLNGPGNDFRHQLIITHVIYALMDKFIKTKKYKNYIPLPELSLKPESPQIPDITIWKKSKNQLLPVILIEICWKNKIADEVTKLTTLMDNQHSIEEAFIIDKEELKVKRIYRTKTKAKKPSVPQASSRIETFKLDLSQILIKILENKN